VDDDNEAVTATKDVTIAIDNDTVTTSVEEDEGNHPVVVGVMTAKMTISLVTTTTLQQQQ
jgi:hypothetical protein